MEILKEIDGLKMWRPLLCIEKKHIIDYANINKIPYLYDSTPEWSVRGKIRDKIRPAFLKLKNNEDREEDSIIESFFDLKDYVANTQHIFKELIINNLVSKLEYTDIANEYRAFYSKDELFSLKIYADMRVIFQKFQNKMFSKSSQRFL